ncbi:ACT domain-containing protein [Oribacterium sp. KHPX15]|uniref:ACT domain-containing protein n=1 Tax=unclassified Oribacterium TaxID=2629782 RepID=UPI0004E1F10C|nr:MULTISPECIES: ACT domain-containing protein [unclassified Oribacterium]MBO6307439.1 ACT domain-containing protein [Oribacterium sp.]MBR1857497.1 ACT domain-containing protein [Oribacterium sp.]SDZ91664.1 ACT domain-containing protein [Oribacterium sp. KHPX15]
MKKAIITVVGKDSVGIIAKVCTFLSEANINILDISQTITGGFFNMMMIVDVSGIKDPFDKVAGELTQYGKDRIGVDIKMQLEEIFTMMHRI